MDRILDRVGLQRRQGAAYHLWPALGVLGTGVLIGAGLGLMFAPKPGGELRRNLRRQAERFVPARLMPRTGNGHAYDEMSREELYELAREREIEGRSHMSKAELIEILSH